MSLVVQFYPLTDLTPPPTATVLSNVLLGKQNGLPWSGLSFQAT